MKKATALRVSLALASLALILGTAGWQYRHAFRAELQRMSLLKVDRLPYFVDEYAPTRRRVGG